MNRLKWAWTPGQDRRLPGEDLTVEQIRQLEAFAFDGLQNNMGFWWQDKATQIVYRLVGLASRNTMPDHPDHLRDEELDQLYSMCTQGAISPLWKDPIKVLQRLLNTIP